jgi:hypothetical protein
VDGYQQLGQPERWSTLEHTIPAIGTVHAAGTQSAAFQITELVEYE